MFESSFLFIKSTINTFLCVCVCYMLCARVLALCQDIFLSHFSTLFLCEPGSFITPGGHCFGKTAKPVGCDALYHEQVFT